MPSWSPGFSTRRYQRSTCHVMASRELFLSWRTVSDFMLECSGRGGETVDSNFCLGSSSPAGTERAIRPSAKELVEAVDRPAAASRQSSRPQQLIELLGQEPGGASPPWARRHAEAACGWPPQVAMQRTARCARMVASRGNHRDDGKREARCARSIHTRCRWR